MAHAERNEEVAEQESQEIAKVDRKSRTDAAVTLRIYGFPYTEIAKELGYVSAHAARIAVERGLAAAVGDDDREQRRHIEARRLEKLLRSVMPRAVNPQDPEQLGYVRASLSLIDRHARLYGLDAPQEMVLYNPTATELEAWIGSKTALMQQDLPDEANIIEGEVIDSDLGDDE